MKNIFNVDNPFWCFMGKLGDLILLNILFIIFSMPIVTIGASITSIYSITMKMVKKEEVYVLKGFLWHFRKNFKQSTIVWLIFLLFGIMLFMDMRISMIMPNDIGDIFRIIFAIIFPFYILMLMYSFPYIARFNNSIKNILKDSFLISVFNIKYTIVLIAIISGLITFMLLTPATLIWGFAFSTLIGFSIIALVNSYFYRKIFKKYE